MKKIVILTSIQHEFYSAVINLGFADVEIFAPETQEEIEMMMPQADVVLAEPPLLEKYLDFLPSNIWVQSTFAGIDNLMKEGMRKEYILTNIRDVYGPMMAEYVFGYILRREKHIDHFLAQQQKGVRDRFSQPSLKNKTIGILGTGSIGQHIAKVAQAFEMKTVGISYSGEGKEYFDTVYGVDTYKDHVKDLHYIVNVLPNTPETYNLIDSEFRNKVAKESYFINIGRGRTVHVQDLIDALENGMLAGAVLDVFETEPLPPDSPLRSTKNLIITPHVSGYPKDNTGIIEVFAKNWLRYTAGEDLLYRVDFTKGY